MATTIQPYLFFDGDCRQAMELYARALGGETTITTFGIHPWTSPRIRRTASCFGIKWMVNATG